MNLDQNSVLGNNSTSPRVTRSAGPFSPGGPIHVGKDVGSASSSLNNVSVKTQRERNRLLMSFGGKNEAIKPDHAPPTRHKDSFINRPLGR